MAIANGYIPNNTTCPVLVLNILKSSHPSFVHCSKVSRKKINHLLNIVMWILWSLLGETYLYSRKIMIRSKKSHILWQNGIPVLILGPGWSKLFPKSHPLITLIATKYRNYPLVYNLMKIFVSLSIHEGGPLPVLESMCCGAYPIITNTGFAFDVLKGCDFGDLIDPFYPSDKITRLISDRYHTLDTDIPSIREHASQFSFANLAEKIISITH